MKLINLADIQYQQREEDEIAIPLDYDDLASKSKLQVVRVFPGGRVKPHKHNLRTELIQIVSGTGKLIVNGQETLTGPGAFVLCQPGDVHELTNTGQEKLVVSVLRVNDSGDDDIEWVSEKINNG